MAVPYTPFPTQGPNGAGISVDTSGAFGEQIGRSLQGVGEAVGQFAQVAVKRGMEKQDATLELLVNDASTEAMKRVTAAYGEFSKSEGRTTQDRLPAFQKTLDTIYKETLETMPNLQAKAKLARSLRYITDTYYKYSESYASSQFKKWQDDSYANRAAEAGAQASLAINNPDRMEAFLAASDHSIEQRNQQNGLDSESGQILVRKNRGANVENIVSTMLQNGDLPGAAAMASLYGDQVDPDSKIRIQKLLMPAQAQARGSSAARYALDTGPGSAILEAQIQQESGGATGLTSPKGAAGIMQIMPETAKMLAAELGLPYDPEKLLNDKGYNIALGTRYMDNLLKKYGGNYTLALAAYNAGPGKVDDWVSRFGNPNDGSITNEAWAEKIPYNETKDYVKTILNNAAVAPQYPAGELPPRDVALRRLQAATEGDPTGYARGLADVNQEYTIQQAAFVNEQRQQKALEDAQKAADEAAQNEYIADSMNPKGPQKSTVDIANDPRLTPVSKRTLIAFVAKDAEGGSNAKVSRDNMTDLMRRLNLPTGNPEKITSRQPLLDAFIAGKLTRADFNFLDQNYKDAKTPEGDNLSVTKGNFLQGMKPQITDANPLLGKLDPTGSDKFYQFQYHVDQMIQQYRASGKDPYDLFDPAKPDYIGKPEALKPFKKTLQESQQDVVNGFGGGSLDIQGEIETEQEGKPGPGLGVGDILREGLGMTINPQGVNRGAKSDSVILPKRKEGESIEDFDKRNGPQSYLYSPSEFGTLSLAEQLKTLEKLLG